MDKTQIAKVDGSQRELVTLSLSESWTAEEAKSLLAGQSPCQAIAHLERGLTPLVHAEPELNGAGAKAVRDWLKPIGVKINPSMAPEACSVWLTAMTMALSDFPAKVAAQAARNAIHIPMQFFSQVHRQVREEAEKLMERHNNALRRLQNLRREIERAANPPQPMIAAPIVHEPLPPSEIRAMSSAIRSLGLACGALTQVEIDAAGQNQEI